MYDKKETSNDIKKLAEAIILASKIREGSFDYDMAKNNIQKI